MSVYEEGFTSREVLELLNDGGCLCTLGRGPCQAHANPEQGVGLRERMAKA